MTVTQMIKSDVDEAVYILEILSKYSVACSLELKLEGKTDNLVSVTSQPVKVEYFENYDGERDVLVIELGESEFSLPLNLSVSKDISDYQVFLYIGNEEYDVWLNSELVPPEAIMEINSYQEPEENSEAETEISAMMITSQERQLIEYIRTLDFDDMLNALDGIKNIADDLSTKSTIHSGMGYKRKAQTFKTQAENMDKLEQLLGDANEEYRKELSLVLEENN
jgi:hypothetical protein